MIDPFLVMRYAAWALFLWLPIGLLAGAWLARGSPPLARTLAGAALLDLGVGGWAFLIEPHWLEITTVHVTSDAIAMARMTIPTTLRRRPIRKARRSVAGHTR